MADGKKKITRRSFTKAATAAAAVPALFHIVPSNCLAQNGKPAPSDTLGGALIGVGGRGPSTYRGLCKDLNVVKRAECDVKWVGRADNKTKYTDFRRVLERKDIDLVAIATPPHWHALISIAAMEAGKDVLCEKPATRFIAEGRAVAEASKRYKRVYQIGTFGRFNKQKGGSLETHKLMRSGLIKDNKGVWIKKGGLKVKQWSGKANLKPTPPPESLDWDMYCGPSPIKPYVRPRTGGTHRGYWDYEGGGLSDMGQHALDPFQFEYGKDDTSPVEIQAYAPPAHPEVCAMWGWVEMKYADGFTLVLESGEWGDKYDRKKGRGVSRNDLSKEDQEKFAKIPDPKPMLTFAQAVKTRGQAGGNAEAAHRCATLLHLANIAIRTGRKLKFDPVKERFIGDEMANRLVDQPMRAPWHL
jgi:myo-inositol 2-dehydrogenase/D-chiro-inositol 1-dehydrogenase